MIIDDKYTVHSVNTPLVQIDILIEVCSNFRALFLPGFAYGYSNPNASGLLFGCKKYYVKTIG